MARPLAFLEEGISQHARLFGKLNKIRVANADMHGCPFLGAKEIQIVVPHGHNAESLHLACGTKTAAQKHL